MKNRIVRRQFLTASAAALGVSHVQNAFSRPYFDPPGQVTNPTVPPGQTKQLPTPSVIAKKEIDPVSLSYYEKNPFRRTVGNPLTPLEAATRRLPGEVSGQGLGGAQ